MKLKFLFFILFIISAHHAASASDFQFTDVDLTFTINEDGSVEVSEYRTYYFDGEFSWADYSLPATFDDIRDISVSEDGRPYRRIDDEDGAPETFYYDISDEELYIRWNYEAANESRTFQISYTLDGVIHGNEEWSEFFWEAISDEWGRPTQQLSVSVRLPSGSYETPHFWLRTPSEELNSEKDNSRFVVNGGPVSADHFVKIRTVFPSEMLSVAPSDAPEVNPEWAVGQEEAWEQDHQRSLERQALLSDIAEIVAYVVIVLSLGGFMYGWRNRQKMQTPAPSTEIPDVTPAIAAWQIHLRQPGSTSFAATIFDLARREALYIKEQPVENESWFSDNTPDFEITPTGHYPSDADETEKMLLDYIDQRADGENILLSKLFEDDENSNFMDEWFKKLHEIGEKQIAYKSGSQKRHHWVLGIGIGFALLSFFVLAYHLLLFFVTMAAGLLLASSSYFYLHFTPECAERYHQIKSYYKGLSNAEAGQFRDKDEKVRHLCYAIGFGLADKHLEKLTANLPDTHFMTLQSASIHTAITGFSSSASTSASSASAAGSAGGGASGGAG